jgi:hypothetical protein
MIRARLLAAALLLWSLPALTQDNQTGVAGSKVSDLNIFNLSTPGARAATPSDPWKFSPSQLANAEVEKNPLDRLRIGEYKIFPLKAGADITILNVNPNPESGVLVNGGSGQEADTTCYAIRSYVVARDSKDSDSTHPAGYSTCRPSDRYQVKSAEIRVQSADR